MKPTWAEYHRYATVGVLVLFGLGLLLHAPQPARVGAPLLYEALLAFVWWDLRRMAARA